MLDTAVISKAAEEAAIFPRGQYRRDRDLPALLTVPAHWLKATDMQIATFLIERLSHALVREAGAGWSGHWSYSEARHRGLAAALRGELEAYEATHLAPRFGVPA